MNAKSILSSKVLWANLLTMAVTFAGYLPEDYAVPALGVLNILLRFLTTQPVALKLPG